MWTDGHDEANRRFPQFRERTQELTQEPVPVPLCPPQTPHRVDNYPPFYSLTFGSLHTAMSCPLAAARLALSLIDARSVKPTALTFCPGDDSTGRNNCCWSVQLHLMQNMLSKCTRKLHYTDPNLIIREVPQPLPMIILNL